MSTQPPVVRMKLTADNSSADSLRLGALAAPGKSGFVALISEHRGDLAWARLTVAELVQLADHLWNLAAELDREQFDAAVASQLDISRLPPLKLVKA